MYSGGGGDASNYLKPRMWSTLYFSIVCHPTFEEKAF